MILSRRAEERRVKKGVERRKNFRVDFFSASGKRKHAKFRENLGFRPAFSAFRSSGASPRRDAMRYDAMRSIIEIDHAEGDVGGGRRGDWSREITLLIHFTRSVRTSTSF